MYYVYDDINQKFFILYVINYKENMVEEYDPDETEDGAFSTINFKTSR